LGKGFKNKSLEFQGLDYREMQTEMCCVFGRSHNDFGMSVSVNETTAERFENIRDFGEGIDEVLN